MQPFLWQILVLPQLQRSMTIDPALPSVISFRLYEHFLFVLLELGRDPPSSRGPVGESLCLRCIIRLMLTTRSPHPNNKHQHIVCVWSITSNQKFFLCFFYFLLPILWPVCLLSSGRWSVKYGSLSSWMISRINPLEIVRMGTWKTHSDLNFGF